MLVRKPARQVLLLLLTAALALTSCNIGATPAPAVDVNAINTAAFSTAMAQMSSAQTQTALAAPSATPMITNTPLSLVTFPADGSAVPGANTAIPTFSFNASPSTNTTPAAGLTPLASPLAPAGQAPTASMGDACNNSAFEGDITIPDGTVVDPGTNFTKVWSLRNTGSCTWDEGYSLVYIGGSNPDLDPYDYNFSKSTDKDFVKGGDSINIAVNLTSPCTPGTYQGSWRMRNDQGYFFGTFLTVSIVVKEKRKNCGK